jgi:hypothetical protein
MAEPVLAEGSKRLEEIDSQRRGANGRQKHAHVGHHARCCVSHTQMLSSAFVTGFYTYPEHTVCHEA